jgi:hypothetical protein
MSLRAFVALVAVIVFGAVFVIGTFTGNYYWLVLVLIVYVAWMFIRDGLPAQGRLPISWYQTDRYLRARRWFRR